METNLKILLITLIIAQLILICVGVYFLTRGKIEIGLFQIIVNIVFIIVNLNTLKRLKNAK